MSYSSIIIRYDVQRTVRTYDIYHKVALLYDV